MRRGGPKYQAQVNGTFDIAYNMLDSKKMSFNKSIQELTDSMESVSNVKLCDGQVSKGANERSVECVVKK